MGPLGKEYVVTQLKAGEQLLHRAGHIAVGGIFLIFEKFVTVAFLLCDFGQKVGEEGMLLV